MSPRLTSSSDSVPASRSPARVRSSTATPADPNRSKKADCGLTAATAPAERLDAGQRERLEPGHGVGQAPLREQRGVRVDAGAERPELVHRGAQPVAVGVVAASVRLMGGPSSRGRCRRRRRSGGSRAGRPRPRARRRPGAGALGSLKVAVPTCTARRTGGDQLERVAAGAHSPDADERRRRQPPLAHRGGDLPQRPHRDRPHGRAGQPAGDAGELRPQQVGVDDHAEQGVDHGQAVGAGLERGVRRS